MSGLDVGKANRCKLIPFEVCPWRAISGVQLAPNGRHLSFVHSRRCLVELTKESRRTVPQVEHSDLYLISAVGGYPQPITSSGDFFKPAAWSPNGEVLAFERGPGLQTMSWQGADLRTVLRVKLASPSLDIGDAYLSYPTWRPTDGQFILVGTTEAPVATLEVVRADGGAQNRLFSVDGSIVCWDWSPDGRYIAAVTRSQNGWDCQILVLEAETGLVVRTWDEPDCEYKAPIAAWTPDGKHIVFRSNRSGWAKLWIVGLDNAEPCQLTKGDWDDYAFRFSLDGQRIVYASRAATQGRGSGDDLWLMGLCGEPPAAQLTQLPGVTAPLAWSRDGQVYFWHSSPTEPGDLWSVSDGGGNPSRLTTTAPLQLTHIH